MKVLVYDCFSGISGDMNLGAMVSLGVDPEYLIKELEKLNLPEQYKIRISNEKRRGIEGTRVDIILENQKNNNKDHNENQHVLSYEKSGKQDCPHHHEQYARNLEEILGIIRHSRLDDKVKIRSIRMFTSLAEAEAQVHGVDVSHVHFHEVGGTDSILDIVGAAICLEYLNVDKIMASRVELGGGFVRCLHGIIPVPAPAVLELLKGVPVSTGKVQHETTTPTGAVILATNVDEYTDNYSLRIQKTGYGVGKRDLDIPNVLRVLLGTLSPTTTQEYIIETNIDDMNPEWFEYIEESLFKSGAKDVFKTPIIMKKGRPAIILSVLVSSQNVEKIQNIIFKETSAIGFRKYPVEKVMLPREIRTISTKYGQIKVKYSFLAGNEYKVKPEYEDCKRIAREKNVPLQEIYKEIDNIVMQPCHMEKE